MMGIGNECPHLLTMKMLRVCFCCRFISIELPDQFIFYQTDAQNMVCLTRIFDLLVFATIQRQLSRAESVNASDHIEGL
jgi:hypothetical protein